MTVSPYLFFNGNCEEAFTFYERVLGGKIEAMMTHEGAPEPNHGPPGWEKKIMHAHMTVGGTSLMGFDSPPDYYQKPQGFSVAIALQDVAEAERVFQALSENGDVEMPIQETFWALRFGMLTDRFGIRWMINCARPE